MNGHKQSPQGAAVRAKILSVATTCACTDGVQWITRANVAQRMTCAPALINYHWGSMLDLKRAVFAEAVRLQILPLIAQGLADGNEACRNAPAWLREKAANWSARRG